jgi:hypothetical protein
MLEAKLIYVLMKYEGELDKIKQFVLYQDACKKHIEGFKTEEFIVRANLTFFSVEIGPHIQIDSFEAKSDTTLFSLIIEEEKGEKIVSIHFTKGQFMYSEFRKIPGLSD